MMRMRAINGIVALGCCLFVVSAPAAKKAKGTGKAGPPSQKDMAKMMAEYEKLASPGPQHMALTDRVGKWDYTSKAWMQPGAPPTESKGTSQVRAIFDGRFVIEDVSGEMMGRPFKGMGVTGYDNFRKQHIGTWCDNMGTSIMMMTGKMDKSGTLTMTGRSDDPMSGENKLYKTISKTAGKDRHSMEMWEVAKRGKPIKIMEIHYTRNK